MENIDRPFDEWWKKYTNTEEYKDRSHEDCPPIKDVKAAWDAGLNSLFPFVDNKWKDTSSADIGNIREKIISSKSDNNESKIEDACSSASDCYVTTQVKIYLCQECPHFSRGFLGEPNECGYFKKAYEHFVPNKGIPEWCPLK